MLQNIKKYFFTIKQVPTFASAQNRTEIKKDCQVKYKFNYKTTKVQQMIDMTLQAIASNKYQEGDNLPSINSLKREYNVSRDTVFKAFLELKARGIIDSVPGKGYFVASAQKSVLLLLDEYSPFKESFYNTLNSKLNPTHKIDLWFHQYNENFFNEIVQNSIGKYNKYLVMNYHNEKFSNVLSKIDKKKLLLLDFGKFDKSGYYYLCQDFDKAFTDALKTITDSIKKYNKLVFVMNKEHQHPRSSIAFFTQFCEKNSFKCHIIDEIKKEFRIEKNAFYIVIKQTDVVKIIKAGKKNQLKPGEDYGILAYNENPFYEVIENGISSIGIDWEEMGQKAAKFVLDEKPLKMYLPTKIIKRASF